jgi:hypothetical protein
LSAQSVYLRAQLLVLFLSVGDGEQAANPKDPLGPPGP